MRANEDAGCELVRIITRLLPVWILAQLEKGGYVNPNAGCAAHTLLLRFSQRGFGASESLFG